MTDLCCKLFGGKRTFIYAEAGHTAMRRQAIKKDLVPNDAKSLRAHYHLILGPVSSNEPRWLPLLSRQRMSWSGINAPLSLSSLYTHETSRT